MKNREDLRIVFMGTPEFAVSSLDALYNNGYNIVGVITTADKKAGRGKKLQISAVKKYAQEKQIKVLTPLNLKDPGFLIELQALKADLQIVVAFRMLPKQVWDMPLMGTFNLHASLLPQYRGAAPINYAIINGEKQTGVTTFLLDQKIDTGKIIKQERCDISSTETAGGLHDKLMLLGAQLVIETVELIRQDKAIAVDQEGFSDTIQLKIASKIYKDDCLINWNQDAKIIYNFIRGLSPYPAAWTYLNNKSQKEAITMKIYAASIVESINNIEIGNIYSDGKNYLRVKTMDHSIDILELQLQGKKRMPVADFLRGFQYNTNLTYSTSSKP